MIETNKTNTNNYARIAGLAYIIIIVTSILSMIFIESKIVVAGDISQTASNIIANEVLFRFGLLYDITMFAGVVLLSASLYIVLKTVNKDLALIALLMRITEVIVGAVTVLIGLLVILSLSGANYGSLLESSQLEVLADLFLRARASGFDIVIFFLSIGTFIFCWLLLKSRYIPVALSVFGILAFILMMFSASANILMPQYADLSMMFYMPGILFELLIGIWLLVKGVNTEYWDNIQK